MPRKERSALNPLKIATGVKFTMNAPWNQAYINISLSADLSPLYQR